MKFKALKSTNNTFCLKDHQVEPEVVLETLRTHNLSVTHARKLILNLLMAAHGPCSVEEITAKLPKNSCDQATIYRSLNQFIEKGLVVTSHLEKEIVHYEYLNPLHHHHHIMCKICKKIESIEECLLNKVEGLLIKKGYVELTHKLEFFGVCANCIR